MPTIQLSQHAVERFQQRVRPGLDPVDAEEQLANLALAGDLVPEPPAWHGATCAQLAPWYLVIADIVLPLKPHWTEPDLLVATTCLARGERSTEARRRRREHRPAQAHRPRSSSSRC